MLKTDAVEARTASATVVKMLNVSGMSLKPMDGFNLDDFFRIVVSLKSVRF